MEEKTRRYAVIDKQTQIVVRDGIRTRMDARYIKRQFEAKWQAESGAKMPSRYFVESDIDHPAGAGVYYH